MGYQWDSLCVSLHGRVRSFPWLHLTLGLQGRCNVRYGRCLLGSTTSCDLGVRSRMQSHGISYRQSQCSYPRIFLTGYQFLDLANRLFIPQRFVSISKRTLH